MELKMGQTEANITPRGRALGSSHQGVYFGALDGFRGVLALLVAIYHTPWGSQFNDTAFLNQGAVIIDLFFVFSGFLMFARLFAHKAGIATTDVGEILPFHEGAPETLYSLLTNLSLTQAMGLHGSLTFNPPAWTISVEFFAYFVFAAMLLWLPPKKLSHFALIGVGVAGIYTFLSRVKPDMNITYDYAFWRCLGGFYTGVIGAEIYRRMKSRQSHHSREATPKSHILEIIALGVFMGFVIYLPGKMQFFVAPFALLFVIVFAFDRGFISKLMMARPFVFLARISYSVYMVHVIIAIAADIFAAKFLSRLFGERWHDVGFNGDVYLIPYIIGVIIALGIYRANSRP